MSEWLAAFLRFTKGSALVVSQGRPSYWAWVGSLVAIVAVAAWAYASQLTDGERVYPGDGVAPYDVIVPALHAIGYTGMLSLELFNEGYQAAGALPVATEGLGKMKQTVKAHN